MALPPALIGPLRAALQTQGFPAGSITDSGTVDPAALLSGVFTSVELRTQASPPVVIRTADLQMGGPPNPLLAFLKPTVILTGPAGKTVIAPYGVSGNGTVGAIVLVGALVAVGVFIGKSL